MNQMGGENFQMERPNMNGGGMRPEQNREGFEKMPFDQMKAKIKEHLHMAQEMIQKTEVCVDNAKTKDDLRMCKQERKQEMQQMKEEQKQEMQQMKEQRKDQPRK
jgi:hypothetical protein